MKELLRRGSWRYTAVAIMSLALVTTTAFLYVHHSQAAQTSATSRDMKIRGQALPSIKPLGSVDLATLPTVTAAQAAKLSRQPALSQSSPLTPAAQRAFAQKLAAHQVALPEGSMSPPAAAAPSAAQIAQNAATSPEFDAAGYTALPPITHSFSGQLQVAPDTALASNPSYIMEATEFTLTVYNFTGTRVFGPTANTTFFQSVFGSANEIVYPQLFWDPTQQHWIFTELQYDITSPSTLSAAFLDIGVSTTPAADTAAPSDWVIYQIPAVYTDPHGNRAACFYDTMGNDYWGLWIDCTAYDANNTPTFVGNFVLGIEKSALYAHAPAHVVKYFEIPRDSGGDPAFRLSSVNEDATPDAEFLVATDAGFGGPFNDLVTCAFTDTHLLEAAGIPSLSCLDTTAPVAYSLAQGARQQGTTITLNPSYGTKQLNYIGGLLYVSMTTFTSNNNDGIWWAILQPKLSPLDPSNPASQTVAPPIIEDNAVWNASDSSVDFFNPTFVGTGQGDGDLVYNVSGVSQFPGVVYTALRASDTPNTLGGLAASSKVVKAGSTVDNSFNWNNYFTCSLDTNLTSRGLVWCGGEYGAGQSDTGGWDTRIFALQN